jgi:hypothetical protein
MKIYCVYDYEEHGGGVTETLGHEYFLKESSAKKNKEERDAERLEYPYPNSYEIRIDEIDVIEE